MANIFNGIKNGKILDYFYTNWHTLQFWSINERKEYDLGKYTCGRLKSDFRYLKVSSKHNTRQPNIEKT